MNAGAPCVRPSPANAGLPPPSQRADGRTLHVRKATRAEPDARAIYQALNLNPAPGGILKLIVVTSTAPMTSM